jgi:2,3-bisphosphoglycerate-dependent phosphoglycerate mutase
VAVVRQVVERHRDEAAILSTHGSLLAIILNAFDSAFAHDFWRTLTFPDVYEMTFRDGTFVGAARVWDEHGSGLPA